MSTSRIVKPLAIYHEHPDWFKPLFAELERRGIAYERLDAASHSYDPSEDADDVPYSLVFNRASPSAYLRGHAQSTFYTLHWLRHLERLGIPTLNGSAVYAFELSKASQLDLLHSLGLPYPRSRAINNPQQAVRAACKLQTQICCRWEGREVSASIGVVAFDGGRELTSSAVMVAADIALYEAKDTGRGRVARYSGRRSANLGWVTRIRRALDEQRLVLEAQPILDLRVG